MAVAQKSGHSTPRSSGETSRQKKRLQSKLYCSFCGKNQDEIAKLIAGPAVFICNECVGKCNEFLEAPIDAPRPRSQVQSIEDLESFSTERLVHWLKTEAALYEHAGTGIQRTIDTLRKRKVSWAVIGAALGMSRQAAWDRFS